MEWGSFLFAAAALKTPTRNGYNALGVNLTFPPFLADVSGLARSAAAIYGAPKDRP